MTDSGEEMPEGAETPPPGTRVMALVRWVLVALMAVVAVASVAHYFGALSHAGPTKAAVYYCPMHPSVVQDHPGSCPICGMTLVLRPGGGAVTSARSASNGVAAPAPSAMGSTTSSTAPSTAPSTVGSGVPGLAPVELSEDRIDRIGMKTAIAKRESLVTALATVGYLAAPESGIAKVHARVNGWIEELLVTKTGDKVARGQALAMVYSPDIYVAQQEYLKARTWAPIAGEDAGALGNLAGDARKRLELLGMSAYEIKEIEKSGVARKNVAIVSPAAGYVTRKSAFKGLYFQPGNELFEIADLATVWALIEIPEREIVRVKVGQVAHVRFVAYPGEHFDGEIKLVYPALDLTTRTVRARVVLANKDARLFPGMYGEVTIDLPTQEGIVVPAEAVVDTGTLQYVFLAKTGGRFEPRAVVVGSRSGDRVQVVAGLAEGDVVVTTGNFLVDSESRLRVAVDAATSKTASASGNGAKPPSGQGPSCDSEFDGVKYSQKQRDCRACEVMHRGMGTMEQDCKNAIARPWK